MSGLPVEFPHWNTYSIKKSHYELDHELIRMIQKMTDESFEDAIKSSQSKCTIIYFDQYANSQMLLKYKNEQIEIASFQVFEYKYLIYKNSMRVNHSNNWTSDQNIKDIAYNDLIKHSKHGYTFRAYMDDNGVYIEKL